MKRLRLLLVLCLGAGILICGYAYLLEWRAPAGQAGADALMHASLIWYLGGAPLSLLTEPAILWAKQLWHNGMYWRALNIVQVLCNWLIIGSALTLLVRRLQSLRTIRGGTSGDEL
jgi:hypothetical protein